MELKDTQIEQLGRAKQIKVQKEKYNNCWWFRKKEEISTRVKTNKSSNRRNKEWIW